MEGDAFVYLYPFVFPELKANTVPHTTILVNNLYVYNLLKLIIIILAQPIRLSEKFLTLEIHDGF